MRETDRQTDGRERERERESGYSEMCLVVSYSILCLGGFSNGWRPRKVGGTRSTTSARKTFCPSKHCRWVKNFLSIKTLQVG